MPKPLPNELVELVIPTRDYLDNGRATIDNVRLNIQEILAALKAVLRNGFPFILKTSPKNSLNRLLAAIDQLYCYVLEP